MVSFRSLHIELFEPNKYRRGDLLRVGFIFIILFLHERVRSVIVGSNLANILTFMVRTSSMLSHYC